MMTSALQEHMAITRQHHHHGESMARAWQESGKTMARTKQARAWQEHGKFLPCCCHDIAMVAPCTFRVVARLSLALLLLA
jgi:hypothetical protein